jgi:hypothetical protein
MKLKIDNQNQIESALWGFRPGTSSIRVGTGPLAKNYKVIRNEQGGVINIRREGVRAFFRNLKSNTRHKISTKLLGSVQNVQNIQNEHATKIQKTFRGFSVRKDNVQPRIIESHPFPERYQWCLYSDLKTDKFDAIRGGFERREAGYYKGVFSAQDFADKKLSRKPLSVDMLKGIHSRACSGVKNTQYDKQYDNPSLNLGGFTRNPVSYYIRNGGMDYATEHGLQGWFDKINEKKWASQFTGSDLSKICSKQELVNSFRLGGVSITNNPINQLVDAEIIIEGFNKTMESPSLTRHEKVEAICRVCQDLERRHLFADGNGRTNCMVLLNGLLKKYGFPMALQADPNRFDGLSLKQLTKEVTYSMRKTELLMDLESKSPQKADTFIRACSERDRVRLSSPGKTPSLVSLDALYESILNPKEALVMYDHHYHSNKEATSERDNQTSPLVLDK